MYYPFLRAKKHELLALLAIPAGNFSKMLPILEPVTVSAQALSSYRNLSASGRRVILITNPTHGDTTAGDVQRLLIAGALSTHPNLTLGLVVDKDFSMTALTGFLGNNLSHEKAIIFRYNPRPSDVTAMAALLPSHPEVKHLIFDDRKIASSGAFTWHPQRVIVSDGFQREEKNANYGSSSSFHSYMTTIAAMGFAGFGDYLTVGDAYSDGGGIGYVVTLHLTSPDGSDLNVNHFSSVTDSHIRGLQPPKFKEACASLATSAILKALPRTTGIDMYLDWHARDHYPSLGPPKQASMQHHLELICSMI